MWPSDSQMSVRTGDWYLRGTGFTSNFWVHDDLQVCCSILSQSPWKLIIFLQTSIGWYKVVTLQMLKLSSIRSFFFLFTSPLRAFSGVLTKPCSFPIPGIGLDSSCCCQVTLAKFCNMNCAGLLLTSLWRTGVWVILLPYFKIFICHWVWCACHLEERCHSLIFLLLTFSLRILKWFFSSLPLFFFFFFPQKYCIVG